MKHIHLAVIFSLQASLALSEGRQSPESVEECVGLAMASEVIVQGLSKAQFNGETIPARDVGYIVSMGETSSALVELAGKVTSEELSESGFFIEYMKLKEEEYERSKLLRKLAEALSGKPDDLIEARTALITHCLNRPVD